MIQKEEIKEKILDHTDIFHIGSLSLTDEPGRETTWYAVKRAKKMGSMISYDPNYRASLWENEETAKTQMRSMIPYADIMKISDEEIQLLTDFKSAEKAAEELYQKGVKIVVVTLGSEGAYVCCLFCIKIHPRKNLLHRLYPLLYFGSPELSFRRPCSRHMPPHCQV